MKKKVLMLALVLILTSNLSVVFASSPTSQNSINALIIEETIDGMNDKVILKNLILDLRELMQNLNEFLKSQRSEKSKDTSILGVKVAGVLATVDTTNGTIYNVELPEGKKLNELIDLEIIVMKKNEGSKISLIQTFDEGKTWRFIVTAEDTINEKEYIIYVSEAIKQ